MRYIRAVSRLAARGRVAAIYSEIRREFGVLGEPLSLHSLDANLLEGVWTSFRESILAGIVPRGLKEAVAVAVSRSNDCPYCVEAHAIMLHAGSSPDAQAIAKGREDEIGDSELREISRWAAATRTQGAPILAQPPFPPAFAPEIIGTAFWIHYINRMVTIFLAKRLLSLTPTGGPLRTFALRMGGLYFRRAFDRPLGPRTARVKPARAALPDDFAWAAAMPAMAGAWATFAAAVDQAGATALPSEVRSLVSRRLKEWQGGDPGPGSSWLEESLSGVGCDLRPAAHVALLAALAPYRIDDRIVAEFRRISPEPRVLLGGVAWSSFAAARRIASWVSGRIA